jgi:hypothetical protein
MNPTEFKALVLAQFPQLRERIEAWDGLAHLEMSEFQRFTQASIEAKLSQTVKQCFHLASRALEEGDKALKNAVYVSFLESLDFFSEAGKEAKSLLPPELVKGRHDILDYDERLLGRKWPTDDR